MIVHSDSSQIYIFFKHIFDFSYFKIFATMGELSCILRGDPEKCDTFGNTGLHLASAKVILHIKTIQNCNTEPQNLVWT